MVASERPERYGPSDKSAAAGIAYVRLLATAAELVWRDLTGRDIGIDGFIEEPTGGFVFVQVKCDEDSFLEVRYQLAGQPALKLV